MAHIPILGGGLPQGFDSQFPRSPVDWISTSTTLIEQLANDGSDTVVSHGSGCFWRNGKLIYLLTARHVLTGRSPFDNAIMSPTGYIPQRLRVYPLVVAETGEMVRAATELEVPEPEHLIADPGFNELRTDIAALACFTDENRRIRCLNDIGDLFVEIYTQVGMDCAIVGYPTTHFRQLMLPVWRRGSIASEPSLPIDGKPMFLLDAATAPGFSGSPVFRRHIGPLPELQPDGSLVILGDRIMSTSLVGIYAGRLQHPHYGGEIPFVFYANRIPDMFASAPAG